MTETIIQRKYHLKEIKEVYALRQAGLPFKDIAKKTGISLGSLWFIHHEAKAALKGKKFAKDSPYHQFYLESNPEKKNDDDSPSSLPEEKNSVVAIREERKEENTQEEYHQKESTENIFSQLNELCKTFEKNVAEAIIQLAEGQAKEIVKAERARLSQQQEYYEKELAKLQAIIVGMKDSSFIGVLQKKFSGK